MLVEDILKYPTQVLTQVQRRLFFEQGYLVLPNYVNDIWLSRLRQAKDDLVEQSRHVDKSNAVYTLDERHTYQSPRLHRVTSPQDHNSTIWEFITDSLMVNLASDIVGPDVKFHHCKFNIKSQKSSQGFKFHQDIPGWPHTDFSPVTIGIYLEDCGTDQGPLGFVPGSHKGPIYPSSDEEGYFVGMNGASVNKKDLQKITGTAGTTLLINCRVIHGSEGNRSELARPLLLPVYSSADSFPYTNNPIPSKYYGEIVKGRAARFASFDTFPCPVPPVARKTPWDRKGDA